MGTGEKRKTFFHEKKPNVGTEVFLLSPNPSPLFKKSGVFCKVESSPLLEIIYPYREQSLSKKSGDFCLERDLHPQEEYMSPKGTRPFSTQKNRLKAGKNQVSIAEKTAF